MILPDKLLQKMNADDRRKLGKAGKTSAEIEQSNAVKTEREIQSEILQFCRLKGWPYDCPAFGKKTRVSVGRPDIIVALPAGVTVWIEVKTPSGRLSSEQAAYLGELIKLGHIVIVPTTSQEAIDALKAATTPTK